MTIDIEALYASRPQAPSWRAMDEWADKVVTALREQQEKIARMDEAGDEAHNAYLAASKRAERAEADAAAVRELMNVYNLGGWTDAVEPMKRALRAEAERDALKADAERWIMFCELWLASTEMMATQDEDGRWSITIIEPVEALPSPGKWTGEDPDAAIDAARKDAP